MPTHTEGAQRPPFTKPLTDIPKVVHFIWIQGEGALASARPIWSSHRKSWERHMPAWRIRVWDGAQIQHLLTTHFPALLPLYNAPRAPKAWKADIGRYAIVHVHGGMYADVTYQVLRNFEWMLATDVSFAYLLHDVAPSESAMFAPVNNCWFAAVPQHPVLARVIRALSNTPVPRAFTAMSVLDTTGPGVLWNALQPQVDDPTVRAISSLHLDPSVITVSFQHHTSPEKYRVALPAAHAIHHSQMSYASGVEKQTLKLYMFTRRNVGPCILVLLSLLIAIGLVGYLISASLWRRNKVCMKRCPAPTRHMLERGRSSSRNRSRSRSRRSITRQPPRWAQQ